MLKGILTTVLSGWILHDRLLHRLRSWSWHFLNSDISQVSVVTQLRCGEIISQGFVANLLVNLSVKEVWKLVNIWWSYGQYCSALFFWLTVYMYCKCTFSDLLVTDKWEIMQRNDKKCRERVNYVVDSSHSSAYVRRVVVQQFKWFIHL